MSHRKSKQTPKPANVPPPDPKPKPNCDNRRETREDTRLKIERWTLVVVIAYGLVTAIQAYIAHASLDLTRKQFTTSERPYVLISGLKRIGNRDLGNGLSKIQVNAIPVNYGKSPATHVIQTGLLLYGVNAEQQEKEFFEGLKDKNLQEEGKGSVAVMPPYIPSGSDSIGTVVTYTSDDNLTAAQIGSLENTHMGIVVVLRFQYQDLAGNIYHTDYCGGFLIGGVEAVCSKYNEVK
jgi:hypothetical protein